MLTKFDPIESRDGAARSQSTFAYRAIRGDILSGRHGPDQKLKIQDLSVELIVSPGAVREALSRLVPEQLVVSRDQRGFAVAPLSIEDLEDLTDLRCEIEAMALRRSVERGDANWEAELLAAAHRLGALPLKHTPEWVELHAAFHTALVAACGSKRLLNLHTQLYEQSERYRGLSGQYDTGRNIPDEHRQIVAMALARDSKGLVKAMLDHIRFTTTLIVRSARAAESSSTA